MTALDEPLRWHKDSLSGPQWLDRTESMYHCLPWLLQRFNAAEVTLKLGLITPCLLMVLLHSILHVALSGSKSTGQRHGCPCCRRL